MASGIVTWVNATHNHGFITPHSGGDDLFVDRSDAPTLHVGATVDFDTRHAARGRLVATNVVLRAAAADERERGPDASAWGARQ